MAAWRAEDLDNRRSATAYDPKKIIEVILHGRAVPWLSVVNYDDDPVVVVSPPVSSLVDVAPLPVLQSVLNLLKARAIFLILHSQLAMLFYGSRVLKDKLGYLI